MFKSSTALRILLLAILLAGLFQPSTLAQAQGNWTQDGYVFDSTGQLSAEFIERFNAEVDANGLPVYVAIVDESLIGPGMKPWDVALRDLWDTYLLPDNFVLIAVSPFVEPSSLVYEYSVAELMAGGVYDPISKNTIPGHSNTAGVEVAEWIHAGVRDGNWEDTVVAGVYEIVVASEALGLGSAPSSIPAATQPPKEETTIVENPVDYSRVLLFGIGAFLALILLVLGIVAYVASTKDKRKIGDAKHRASLSHTAAVNLITGFDQMWTEAGERLKFLELQVSQAHIAAIRARLTTLKSDVSAPLASFESLGDRFDRPESVTEGVFNEIRTQMESQIVAPMRKAFEELHNVIAQIEELEAQVETAPQAVAEVHAIVLRAESAILALESENMNVANLRRELDEAKGLEARAQSALTSRDMPLAADLAEKCKIEAQQALDMAEGYKDWVKSLATDYSAVFARLDPVDHEISDAGGELKYLAKTFAASSWNELKTNPERASKNVERARKLLASAEKLLATQDFEQADNAIDNATLALQEAEMLCKSITNRRADLEKAAQSVRDLHETARKALEATVTFVATNDAEVPEDAERRLTELQRQFQQMTIALGESLPDYLAISKVLTEITKVAGDILTKSKESVKVMDLAESAASAEIESAGSATRRADAYLDDHRRDVDSDARAVLAEAEQLLAAAQLALSQAKQCRDGEEARRLELFQQAAKLADSAEAKAKEALKMAQADVEREEEKREHHGSGSSGGSTTVIVSSPTYVSPSYSPRRDTTPPITNRPTYTPSRSTPSPARPSYTPSRSTPSVTRSTPVRSTPSVSRSTPSRSTPSRSTPNRR